MNCFFLLLFNFSLFSLSASHDVQMTQFELFQLQEELVLTIQVERKDLYRSWEGFEKRVYDSQIAELNDYLQRKTQWVINETSFSICDYMIFQDEEHFIIRGYFENVPPEIYKVDFWNEFLIEEINGQLSIIHLSINEKFRSFKMDKNRIVIHVDYS